MSKQQRITQAVQFVFNKYDTDNSNYLDQDQLKQVLTAVFSKMNVKRQVSDNDVKKMLIALDTDNDGRISRQQLRILVQQCIK